jgi:hypothetical protein
MLVWLPPSDAQQGCCANRLKMMPRLVPPDFGPSPSAALTAHAVSTGRRTRARIVDEGLAACASAPGLMRRARLGKVSSAPVTYREAIQFDL